MSVTLARAILSSYFSSFPSLLGGFPLLTSDYPHSPKHQVAQKKHGLLFMHSLPQKKTRFDRQKEQGEKWAWTTVPHHWLAEKALTHIFLPVWACSRFAWMKRPSPQRDNKGETLIDIARRSGACAEIIGLLSLTPRKLVRWVRRGCSACTHQWLIGGVR